MTNSTFVLVPGAWQGGWTWIPVAHRLREAGHRVVVLTLPGLTGDTATAGGPGIEDAVGCIVDAVVRRDLVDVVLVPHGWAAYPTAGALPAISDRLRALIYHRGFIPQPGRSFLEAHSDLTTLLDIRADDATEHSVAPPSFDFFADRLMPDAPLAAQTLAWELNVAQPGRYFTEALDEAPVTGVACENVYLLPEQDTALSRSGERDAQYLGLRPTPVAGGHLSHLSQPDALADLLAEFA